MGEIYTEAISALWRGQLDWLAQSFRAVVVDSADYTFSSGHAFLSSVPSAARLSTSAPLTGKTVANGAIDAADVTVPGWVGDGGEAVVIYQDTGNASTSRLIAHLDGIVVVSNGSDVSLIWDNGANKIARLTGTYSPTLNALWRGEMDWLSQSFRAVVVDSADYTFSSGHAFLSSVPSAARLSTSAPLTGKTVANGAIDAADVTVPGWVGDGGEAVVIYQDTGNASTSRLVAHQGGLNMVSQGNDFLVRLSNVLQIQ